jgi:hypothetical protein
MLLVVVRVADPEARAHAVAVVVAAVVVGILSAVARQFSRDWGSSGVSVT